MNLTIDAKTFKEFINLIATTNNEAKLTLDETGMHAIILDPSQISMLNLTLWDSAFMGYDIKEKSSFGIDVDAMKRTLSDIKDGHLSLNISEDNIKIKAHTQGGFKSAELKTIDVNDAEPSIPIISFDVKAVIERADILPFLVKNKSISHIKIDWKNNLLRLRCVTEGTKSKAVIKARATQTPNKEYAFTIHPTAYLYRFFKNSSSEAMVISLKTNAPIQIISEGHGIYAAYLIAPRIEGENEQPTELEDFEIKLSEPEQIAKEKPTLILQQVSPIRVDQSTNTHTQKAPAKLKGFELLIRKLNIKDWNGEISKKAVEGGYFFADITKQGLFSRLGLNFMQVANRICNKNALLGYKNIAVLEKILKDAYTKRYDKLLSVEETQIHYALLLKFLKVAKENKSGIVFLEKD